VPGDAAGVLGQCRLVRAEHVQELPEISGERLDGAFGVSRRVGREPVTEALQRTGFHVWQDGDAVRSEQSLGGGEGCQDLPCEGGVVFPEVEQVQAGCDVVVAEAVVHVQGEPHLRMRDGGDLGAELL